jgi:hypothetical protein
MTIKKITLTFLSLSLILFTTIFWQIYLNGNRNIFWEPDDHHHLLIKSSNIKHCQKNDCYEENLFKENIENLNADQRYERDEQIHRITFSYHPLYTFIFEKLSNFNNIFENFKIYHLFLGFAQGLIIFIYLNRIISYQKVFICSLILSLYCFNNVWGISYPTPWTISALIGMLGIFLQIQKNNFGLILIFIASLMHKIGLVLACVGFATWFLYNLKFYFYNSKNFKIFAKEIVVNFIIFFTIFFVGYKIKYSSFNIENLNEFNLYQFEYSFTAIINQIQINIDNFVHVFKRVFYLNPILIIFFISSFFLRLGDKILIIKIFTFVLLIFMITFFVPTGGSTFALGTRVWHIFIINYLILSIASLFFLSKKFSIAKYIKYGFFILLPVFGYLGTALNHSFVEYFTLRNNNYYDFENVKKYQNKFDPNKIVYFETKDSTLYYYLISGFIKNNFYNNKSNPHFEKNFSSDYLIIENPLKVIYGSDIFLNENLTLNLNNVKKEFYLKFFANRNTSININNKKYNLNKGYNLILFNQTELKFKKIEVPIFLVGLKINKNQKLDWPWGKDINLKLDYSLKEILNRRTILKKFYFTRGYENYNYNFNFLDLEIQINNRFIKCGKEKLSDLDSTIVLKLKC